MQRQDSKITYKKGQNTLKTKAKTIAKPYKSQYQIQQNGETVEFQWVCSASYCNITKIQSVIPMASV